MKPALFTAAVLGLGALAGPAAAQIADVCRPVVEQDGSLVTLEEPRFSIANSPGILQRVNVAGELAMVTCERRTIVPLPGDYRVIRDLGVPLTLVAGERVSAVEQVEGRLHVRMVQGQVLPGEIQTIQGFLNDAQAALDMIAPLPGRRPRN